MPSNSAQNSVWPLADDEPDSDVLERRKVLKQLELDFDEKSIPPKSMGLALSGGGIRSATVSLGFVQALVRRKRLLDFDYLSTVSGGGYLGSFLRSLYLPENDRGAQVTGTQPPAPQLTPKATQGFVEDVLSCDAKADLVSDPTDPTKSVRNPIWWLREHGRYLAPNGPTDYSFAISYLARNWIAMIYTFLIAAVAVFLALFCLEWAVLTQIPTTKLFLRLGNSGVALSDLYLRTSDPDNPTLFVNDFPYIISPLIILPLCFLFISVAAGIGYWTTVSLERGTPLMGRLCSAYKPTPKIDFALQWVLVLISTIIAWLLLCVAESRALDNGFAFWKLPWPWSAVALGLNLSNLALVIAGIAYFWTLVSTNDAVFANELRRRLTKLGALSNQCLLITGAIAFVDTLALAVVTKSFGNNLSTLIGGVVPAAAWLIAKIPQWFAGGKASKLLGEHIWTFALILGGTLFGLVALSADVMVLAAVWDNADLFSSPWVVTTEHPDGFPFFPVGAIGEVPFFIISALVLSVVVGTGAFAGFINLSSLHNLYAGRLTRAYLGASNLQRLREAAAFNPNSNTRSRPVTENDPNDYIDVKAYQRTASASPIHLINVTLNETHSQSASQITDRDRKGVPVVFSPGGIWVDAGHPAGGAGNGFHSWADLKKYSTESLTVGKLCAISGAAFSAGMGMRTTLGGALSFTFANVRLGYWWSVNDLFMKVDNTAIQRSPLFLERFSKSIILSATAVGRGLAKTYRYAFASYRYLLSEMTALYTRGRHVYLSDGGHFENSGTYELLRRHVPVIVTLDNGADPNFEFEDLQNLVRKARIDLGVSVNVAEPAVVQDLFGRDGAGLFFNGGDRDWREAAKSPGGPACALLLEVFQTSGSADRAEGFRKIHRRGRIVWVKPRMFDGLPPDVTGYGGSNPTFPQQTTSDQFFDEAQWESYRAVGYGLGETLLNGTARGIDVFRELVRT